MARRVSKVPTAGTSTVGVSAHIRRQRTSCWAAHQRASGAAATCPSCNPRPPCAGVPRAIVRLSETRRRRPPTRAHTAGRSRATRGLHQRPENTHAILSRGLERDPAPQGARWISVNAHAAPCGRSCAGVVMCSARAARGRAAARPSGAAPPRAPATAAQRAALLR